MPLTENVIFIITDLFFIVYFNKVVEDVSELKQYAYRIVSMRTPEYPVANEKILKWIENANTFEENIKNTLDSIVNES